MKFDKSVLPQDLHVLLKKYMGNYIQKNAFIPRPQVSRLCCTKLSEFDVSQTVGDGSELEDQEQGHRVWNLPYP